MRERLRPFLDQLASFLAPGLVLLLLGIQVAFGLRGFDQPSESALVVLQVPGILLGWGGVVLLLPLLVWMVLDWWGYDLGGFALKGLGSAVLGIAAGALFGLFGGEGAGGVVGGGLADVLHQTVGTIIGAIVLGIMAVPAGVLAFSLRRTASPAASSTSRPAAAKASAGGTKQPDTGKDGLWSRLVGFFKRERVDVQNRWYPKQKFDAWGNEMPMEFGGSRDVGGIRFADEAPDETPTEGDAPTEAADATAARGASDDAPPSDDDAPATVADLLEGEERLPTIPELLAGKASGNTSIFDDDPSGGTRELASDAADDGPVHVGSGARGGGDAPQPTAYPSSWGEADRPAASGGRRDEGLLPGVRYADVTPPRPEAEGGTDASASDDAEVVTIDVTEELGLSEAIAEAVRGPAPAPADTHGRMAASVRESVRRSVEALRGDGETPAPKSRYLEKLEASGMFEFARPLKEPEPPKAKAKAPRKKAAAKKKAAGRKKLAKKKAAPKKAAARKKVAKKVAKKKTARTKSAAKKAKKKAAKKRASGPSPAVLARRRKALLDALRIERLDPLFSKAVDAALERGSASSMLLTRRLGLPFGRANALLERMVAAGVVGEASPSGSNPLRISAEDWASLDH